MIAAAEEHAAVFDIDTGRLRMRPLAAGDAGLYCALYTDEQAMRFVGPTMSHERAVRSFRNTLAATLRRPLEQLVLAVFAKTTARPIGLCSIQQIDLGRRRAETGIMLMPTPARQAHGFAKECVVGLMTRVFAALPLDEIWATTATDHLVAQRVLAGVGFTRRIDSESTDDPGRSLWCVHRTSWLAGRPADRGEEA